MYTGPAQPYPTTTKGTLFLTYRAHFYLKEVTYDLIKPI